MNIVVGEADWEASTKLAVVESTPCARRIFRNAHLSVSRLALYEQCPLAFFFRYVEPGPIEDRGNAADFGVVLHAALEGVKQWVIDQEYEGPFPADRLLDAYRSEWTTSKLVGVSLYQEGLEIVRSYARRNPFIDHMKILGVEIEFNIMVGGFKMNGFIDEAEKLGDDGVYIRDYKSNRMLYTSDELENNLQMSVYGLAARTLWPWARRVEFGFDMLRHDTVQETRRTASQIDDAGEYVVSLGKRTESDVTWEARLNPNCGYCDSRRRCARYQEVLAGGHELGKMASASDIGSVLRERNAVATVAKMAYARKEEYDKILKARLAVDGEYEAAGFKVGFVGAMAKSYPDASGVVRAFVTAGLEPGLVMDRLLKVDRKAVEDLVVERFPVQTAKSMMLKNHLEGMMKMEPMTPRLDVREVKTAKKVKEKDVAAEKALVGKAVKRVTAKP